MKNESVQKFNCLLKKVTCLEEKLLDNSYLSLDNVLEEKHKMVKQKICIKKTNTFTIIANNFDREQLNTQ